MNTLNQTALNQLNNNLEYFKLNAASPLSNWVNGKLYAGQGENISLLNPVTNLELTVYSDAGPNLLDKAVKAAQEAQVKWQSLTASQRGRLMLQAIAGL